MANPPHDRLPEERRPGKALGLIKVPEANATRHRAGKGPPAKKQPYDRGRIVLDPPQIKIHSRDFH